MTPSDVPPPPKGEMNMDAAEAAGSPRARMTPREIAERVHEGLCDRPEPETHDEWIDAIERAVTDALAAQREADARIAESTKHFNLNYTDRERDLVDRAHHLIAATIRNGGSLAPG